MCRNAKTPNWACLYLRFPSLTPSRTTGRPLGVSPKSRLLCLHFVKIASGQERGALVLFAVRSLDSPKWGAVRTDVNVPQAHCGSTDLLRPHSEAAQDTHGHTNKAFSKRRAEDVTGEMGGDDMQHGAAGWNLAWHVAKDS